MTGDPTAGGRVIEPDRFEQGRPMLLVGLRQYHTFDAVPRSVPEQWVRFNALRPIAGQRPGVSYGAVCRADADGFEYMCAVEVESFEAAPADLDRMRVPAQRYAVFRHDGNVARIRETWEAIWSDWVPRSGIRPADTPDFERYDERYDPATGEGGFEIWFPVGGGD